MRYIGIIFMIFPLIFMGVGGYLANKQASMIARAIPTQALIISKRIESSRDSDGNTNYKPLVSFSFEFEGQAHSAENVHVIPMSSGQRWANRVLDRYPIGETVTAWVDPQDPSDSFLDRTPGFAPYIFVMFPMIFFALGSGMVVSALSKNDTAPTAGDSASGTEGWFLFKPKASTQAKLRGSIAAAVVWDGLGVLVLAHYVMVGGGFDRLAPFALAIYFGLGMIPVGMSLYRFRVNQMLHDAVVMLDADTLERGGNAQVYVEQAIKSGCHINALKVGLKCERTTRTSSGGKTRHVTKTVHEEEHPLAENQTVSSSDALHLGHTLTIPTEPPASSDPKGDYPRTLWTVTVHTDIANAPDYKAEFPVQII